MLDCITGFPTLDFFSGGYYGFNQMYIFCSTRVHGIPEIDGLL